MKTRSRSAPKTPHLSSDFGAQLHAIKQDLSTMMSLLQTKWGELRRDTHPGETVSELVKKSGLDQTWNGLKEAAVSTVQPWLGSTTTPPARKRRASTPARKAAKTAKKVVKSAKKAATTAKKTVKKTAKKAVSRKTTAAAKKQR